MDKHGALLYCDEAAKAIDRIQDPVTRNLVNMAFVHMINRIHLDKLDTPRCDVDVLHFVTTLTDFFAEHDVIARTLDGETVGAWFEDEK